jgi:hypothetical protein
VDEVKLQIPVLLKVVFVVRLLAVLPIAAQAQTESISVETKAIEGVWEITGAPNNIFCRIERNGDDLAGYCATFGPEKGSVEIDEGRMHIAFGSMALRLVIDGPMQSGTRFTGRLTAKIFGVEHDSPGLLTGSKMILSDAAPDEGGKAGLLRHLLEEMRLGKPTETFTATGPAPFVMLAPATLRTMGATEAIIHIGSLFTGKAGSIRAQVYVVEFANGESICSLNQRDDGALDQFQCV